MKKLLRNLVSIACLAMSGLALATAVPPAACTGPTFNPITATDWNNMFPITIAGAVLSSNSNTVAPLMAAMPPVCVCPTIIFGMPFVGIGVTYWQPSYVSEIERRPGCLNSLGGVSVLSAYANLHSEQAHGTFGANKAANRMQVHWYEYPLFSMLEMMTSSTCKSSTGFNLAYVTEVDPLWQDDLWGAIFAPESALFSNPVATAVCAVDSVASNFDFPMDPLFWCAGSWGTVYPLTGNSQHTGVPFTMNNQIQAKFIARNHRMGLQMQTIGPSAICSSHPNPIWVKSQYRYNQVAPIPRRGRAVVTGSTGLLFQFPPITNVPTQEHTTNLIWQGQQCCLKVIP
jgi:conjugal transfer pilus assembly protein TraU